MNKTELIYVIEGKLHQKKWDIPIGKTCNWIFYRKETNLPRFDILFSTISTYPSQLVMKNPPNCVEGEFVYSMFLFFRISCNFWTRKTSPV